MQLLATYRHARDDGLQPLSQASSVDNQPRRRALTSPSTTEASCRRRKQAGWLGVSAGGDYASLLLGGRLAELARRSAGSSRTVPERRKAPPTAVWTTP